MAKGNTRDPARERMWRQAIREQARSGLTIRTFCHQNQLAESAFYFWRRELQRRREQRTSRPKANTLRRGRRNKGRAIERVDTPAFVPVHLAQGDGAAWADAGRLPSHPKLFTSSIQIALPGGARIHVHNGVDRQALADVVAILVAAGVELSSSAENAADGMISAAQSAAALSERHRPC